jgi:hypothetical protein
MGKAQRLQRQPRQNIVGAFKLVMQEPSWLFFEGGAWYTREIKHEANAQLPKTVLRIGAANYQTRIFINGKI